ncbi:FGGY-family carbohydrate kinase [Amphibacillus sp. Q70]|uniref:FGGY-family carbohydrate kinase n=1 Tax=Amphibacillus sp. Q70 TaxID=3453416 RepID=UPI003F8417F1
MNKPNYRIVIDQSTSGTKLLLFIIENKNPKIIKRLDRKHEQIYPQSGWVEHNPVEIIDNVESLFDELFKITRLTEKDIKSISITNQRETVVVWDKTTGNPVYNALVWQCNRSINICRNLSENGKEDMIQEKTGLKLDTYFSAPKLKWLFTEKEWIKSLVRKDALGIGTIDAWLIWHLTNQKVYATDASNASRTLLYNIHKQEWDEELCNCFETPIRALPEVKSSNSFFGEYRGIPIIGVIADSQAALYGQGSTNIGDIKATLGTGCSVMMQIGSKIHWGDRTILKTVGWKINQQVFYTLEGIIRSCTDTLNWLSNELNLFNTIEEGSNLAFSLSDNEGVYFVPGQLGLGAPFWKPDANANFVGLSRSHTKAHMIRAGFESIVYQIKAVIDVMERTSGIKISELNVDGGASKNSKLMQMLSDVLDKKVIISNVEEMSALGALRLAVDITINNLEEKKGFLPQSKLANEYVTWFTHVMNTINQNNNMNKRRLRI